MDPTEAMAARGEPRIARNEMQVGPPPPREPRLRREVRLLRRDGPVKYVRVLLVLRRFHKTLRRVQKEVVEGAVQQKAKDQTAKLQEPSGSGGGGRTL